MSDTTYNGWTNYETWAVNLWMDNDEGSQSYWVARAEELAKDSDTPKVDLADEIEASHKEYMPEMKGVYSDLLTAALGSVNWYEIAENMLSGIEIEEGAEE